MSAAGVTSTCSTVSPLICMPRILPAISRVSSAAILASFTPPALPRPPAWTCALTTTVPPNLRAMRLGLGGASSRPRRAGSARPPFAASLSPDTRGCSRVLRMRRVVHAVIVVPASPCTAARPRASDVMIARGGSRPKRAASVRRTKSIAARIFGAILPSPNAFSSVHRRRLVGGERAERTLSRRSPVGVDRVDVGEDQQQRRRRGRAPAPRPRDPCRRRRRSPPSRASDGGRRARRRRRTRSPAFPRPSTLRMTSQLANAERDRTADDAAQVAVAVGLAPTSPRARAPRARSAESAWPMNFVGWRSAGSFGSTCTCVITVATLRARRGRPVAHQRVLQRLLDHVADPAGRRRDEHAERQRTRFLARRLVAHQLVADLRSVAVHDAHVPAVVNQLDDRGEAFARVAKLIVDGRRLAGRRERIAAERDDGDASSARELSARDSIIGASPARATARARRTRGRTRPNRRGASRRASRRRARSRCSSLRATPSRAARARAARARTAAPPSATCRRTTARLG